MNKELDSIKDILKSKKYIIGIDEVGTGALASDIFVCGIKASPFWKIDGLNDSKKLSSKKRETIKNSLENEVKLNNISYVIARRSNKEIDKFGLAEALRSAYKEIFSKLWETDSLIVVDGNLKFDESTNFNYEIMSLIKGDSLLPSIMAASIIAKVSRDILLTKLDGSYPEYDFASHKGYPSKQHKLALEKFGVCDIHRKSYKPVADILNKGK